YLVVRGLLLILLELTLLRLAWTFNVDYAHYTLAGVIWALGWCMILLAGLVFLPLPVIAVIGLVIIAGHNLFDAQLQAGPPSSGTWLWAILYFAFRAGPIQVAGTELTVLYSIVPWIGVMGAGYAFGAIMTMTPERRRRICFAIGLGAIALFVVLRALELY